MKPYYADGTVTLYHGDALAVLRELPDDSVDAIITDPPYSSGGAYRGDRAASTGLQSAAMRPGAGAQADIFELTGGAS